MAIRVSLDGLFGVKPNPVAILNAAIASGKIQENAESEEGLRPVAAESLSGKIVGLYFSAHWCPPCKGFTPHLAQKYKELVDAGHPIEIIFISSDSSAAEAREYFSEMPWKMLDYECRDEKGRLGKAYSVAGIPTLVLLDESLQLITANGRDAIMAATTKMPSTSSNLCVVLMPLFWILKMLIALKQSGINFQRQNPASALSFMFISKGQIKLCPQSL